MDKIKSYKIRNDTLIKHTYDIFRITYDINMNYEF